VALSWQFASRTFEAIGRIVVVIVLMHLLTPRDFGIAGAALVVLSFTITITQIGVGPALVQRAELTDRHISSGFIFSIAMGIVGGVIVYLCAGLVARFFHMPELVRIVEVMSLSFPLTAPAMVADGLLSRRMAFKTLSAIDAVSFAVGYGAVGIGLAWAGAGVWALVIAQMGQFAVRSVLTLIAQPHTVSRRLDFQALKDLLGYGTGHCLAELGNFAALQGDNVVVGRWMGAAALGVYTRAYTFLAQPARLIGMVIDRVLFPAMANIQDELVRVRRAFHRGLVGIALLTIPVSIIVVVLSPEIVLVVLGKKWIDMIAPFQILAASLLFRTSYKICDSVARATGAAYRRAWRQWLYAFLVFMGAWIGHYTGLKGVAYGVSAAITANFLLMLHLSIVQSRDTWLEIGILYLRIAVGAIPTAVVVWGAAAFLRREGLNPSVVLLVSGGLGGVCWLGSLALLGGMVGDEIVWARQQFMKVVGRRS